MRLLAPQFVKLYLKTNNNDVADGEAICEAVAGPNVRYVPVKTNIGHCTPETPPAAGRSQRPAY